MNSFLKICILFTLGLAITAHSLRDFTWSESDGQIKQRLLDLVAQARQQLDNGLSNKQYNTDGLFLVVKNHLTQWSDNTTPIKPDYFDLEPGFINIEGSIFFFHKKIISNDSALVFLKLIQQAPNIQNQYFHAFKLFKGDLALTPTKGYSPLALGGQTVYYKPLRSSLSDLPLFESAIFAGSWLNPSLGHLFVNVLLAWSLCLFLLTWLNTKTNYIKILPFIILPLGFWFGECLKSLIYNSQLSLNPLQNINFDKNLIVVFLVLGLIIQLIFSLASKIYNQGIKPFVLIAAVLVWNGLMYIWGLYDLIEINWTLPLLLIAYLPLKLPRLLPPVLICILISAGWFYLYEKHNNYKIDSAFNAYAEHALLNDDPVAEYMLSEKLSTLDSSQIGTLQSQNLNDLNKNLLNGYLAKYELVEGDSANARGYKSFSIGNHSYYLQLKNSAPSYGLPELYVSGYSHSIANEISMGTYKSGKLVYRKGNYPFPSDVTRLIKSIPENNGLFASAEEGNQSTFCHIYLPEKSEKASLFLLYFLLSIILSGALWHFYLAFQSSFRSRIVISSLFLSTVLMIVFSFINYNSIYDQFLDRTEHNLTEKAQSLAALLPSKFPNMAAISDAEISSLAELFHSDIFLYDSSGFLLASSAPELFKLGLLQARIHPKIKKSSAGIEMPLTQVEQIGELSFLSTYTPVKIGGEMAFINLPYFGKQLELDASLKQHVTSSLSLLIIFWIISLIVAALLANRVTTPLSWLQHKIEAGSLMPIDYKEKDEIRMLVDAYNLKLEELKGYMAVLARKERESAWRDLARQIAHEIKNPITPIKLNAQLLIKKLESSEPNKEDLRRFLNGLISQVDVLAKIANEFSAFASLPKPLPAKITLNTHVKEWLQSVHYPNIQIDFTDQSGHAEIFADPAHLTRILNNLLKNASQAINLKQLEKEFAGKIQLSIKAEDDHVLISIQDNGIGMNPETLSKLFTPNFTTKSDGMGLGLVMCKQMLEQANAQISVESEFGIGTLFIINFPIYDAH